MNRLTMMDSRHEQLFREHHKEQEKSSGGPLVGHPERNSRGGIQSRIIQLEFPLFGGSDPLGWIYRVEQFFPYHQTSANQQMGIAAFHLEGKALQWFPWMERSGAIDGWKDFTQALTNRFGPSGFDDPMGLLTKLRQTSNVQDYQKQFENLANQTEGLTKHSWSVVSLRGLKKRFGWVSKCSGPSL